MAAYISFQPQDYFKTLLYAGSASTWNAHTGVGFQPNMTWHKSRTSTGWHGMCDSVRGVDASSGCKAVYTNDASAQESSTTEYLDGYQSDGFTTGVNGSFGGNGNDYVSFCWKAGTTSGLTGGTITPSAYSYNTTSKLSILTYTGTGSNATIAHMLGVKPTAIIIKRLDTSYAWAVWHTKLTSSVYHLELNNSDPEASAADFWNSTDPTSTVFSLGTGAAVNASGATYVAYVFSDIKGYQQHGSYKGNGNANGTFVYTGFAPSMVIFKNIDGTYNWQMSNNKASTSGGTNVIDYYLLPDRDYAEGSSGTSQDVDFLSNGFKFKGDGSQCNGASVDYVYFAWAEQPIVSSNSKAGTAR